MAAFATFALLVAAAAAAATLRTRSADPRHDFDPRCPPAALFDAPNTARECRTCTYLRVPLPSNATAADCARACCGDWSCLSFRFTPATPGGGLSGLWRNADSLHGITNLTLQQRGSALVAASADIARATWSRATGVMTSSSTLLLCFDCEGGYGKNRTGVLSADGATITLARLSSDPPGFTLVFSLLAAGPVGPSCDFLDSVPPARPASGDARATGTRAALPPPAPPPYGASTRVRGARVNASAVFGINGDEFPTTWTASGTQLTGAGDNSQGKNWTPASFFAVAGPPPESGAFAPDAFALRGDPFAVSDGSLAERLCPRWNPHSPVANIKSSGVISLRDETANGTTIWAVSCFNYGDDPTFNRQRYGPAWFVASRDEGATWAADAAPGLFTGRLAAPRFVQAGAGNDGAPDPAHVYALFPGTENNASFFECNDAAWLGRAPVASVMNRSSWEFFIGLDGAGDAQWDADDSIAVAVLDWPLHTSVQQVNWHAGLQRFVAANWVCVAGKAPPSHTRGFAHPAPARHSLHPLLQQRRWISADGAPRPDHSPDERNARTERQRTWLTLLEADHLWGPWRVFHSDDDWRYSDGSSGAYTPIFPPAWISAADNSLWMVSTQCCGWTPEPPTNHYSFNAQRVDLDLF